MHETLVSKLWYEKLFVYIERITNNEDKFSIFVPMLFNSMDPPKNLIYSLHVTPSSLRIRLIKIDIYNPNLSLMPTYESVKFFFYFSLW